MSETPAGTFSLPVEALGEAGDGIARLEGRKLFIPGALPGEQVRIRLSGGEAELLGIETPSPDRVTPPCPLFGTCGGCALQHLSLPALLGWKAERVARALDSAGFDRPEPSLYQTRPGTRRRMDFAIRRVPGGVMLGLHRRRGDPVDMTACSLLRPQLLALLPPLRQVLAGLGALTGEGGLIVNLLESGPDLTLRTASPPSESDRAKLAAFARAQGIPRISWAGPGTGAETVAQWGPVRETFGGVAVSPPPAAFLQATKDAEEAIASSVVSALPPRNRKDITIELFAGCGTLTFPLAQGGRVLAYEGDAEAASCLARASAGQRVEAHRRDLARQPLLAAELKRARAVVLDPPRSGAGPQMMPLARTEVKDIVYVSCSPAALEKDARLLREAGYAVVSWTVIDQFLWSTEVEAVVAFSRDPKRIKRESSRRSRIFPSRSD